MMPPITNIDDPRYVKAMSHPLRVRILALLDERTASPVELAGWLGATLGTVAYHVRTLERMGLIELVRETRVRGAVEHHYRSKARPRVSDEAWAAAPPIAKQAAVSSSLQTIDAYARAARPPAASITATPTSPAPRCTSTRAAGTTSRAPACACSPRSTASRRPPRSAWSATRTPARPRTSRW